jgi:tetratricopeptide (TPR) repeat protein
MSAALLGAAAATAQSLLLQANTPEEFDAYLRVLDARKPPEVIAAAVAFAQAYPKSELVAHAVQLEMEAQRTLGNVEGAIDAGERAVKLVPNNIPALVTLAGLLPLNSEDPERLSRAEALATQALKLLRSFRVSRFVPLDEWEKTQAQLRSNAHAALGLVAFRRNQIDTATREFESAVALAPDPDPSQYFRLGSLYLARKRLPEAREKLLRAAQMNDPVVRGLAEKTLQSIGR